MASKRRSKRPKRPRSPGPGAGAPLKSGPSRSPPSATRPSNWFLQLGRAKALDRARMRVRRGMLAPEDVPAYVASAGLNRRLSVRSYLSRTVKDLRKFFSGFEARDGYDLSRVHTWNARRAEEVRKYGEYLHNLQSAPFVAVSPTRYRGKRRTQFRQQLRRATGQGAARQKTYVYHVDQTERPTEVRLSRGGQLETRERVKGATIQRQYWYFRDYTPDHQQPQTFAAVQRAAQKMVEEMPEEGWFSLFSIPHGAIDVPVRREFVLATLVRYSQEYTNQFHLGFAETLLGFVYSGTQEEAFDNYNERLSRRMMRNRAKSEAARVQRRRLAFQRRMGRVR